MSEKQGEAPRPRTTPDGREVLIPKKSPPIEQIEKGINDDLKEIEKSLNNVDASVPPEPEAVYDRTPAKPTPTQKKAKGGSNEAYDREKLINSDEAIKERAKTAKMIEKIYAAEEGGPVTEDPEEAKKRNQENINFLAKKWDESRQKEKEQEEEKTSSE